MERGFKSLEVWKVSKALAVSVYKFTREGALKKDYGLVDQMRRASVSIASNIAEGDERHTKKLFVFLHSQRLCSRIVHPNRNY